MYTMKFMTEEQTRRLDTVLITLRQRSEAQAVFLTDRGGNILAENKDQTYSKEDNIIALAAGSFFATRELARLLGEPEFKCVFHQGSQTSVYMQSTASDLLMLVVLIFVVTNLVVDLMYAWFDPRIRYS